MVTDDDLPAGLRSRERVVEPGHHAALEVVRRSRPRLRLFQLGRRPFAAVVVERVLVDGFAGEQHRRVDHEQFDLAAGTRRRHPVDDAVHVKRRRALEVLDLSERAFARCLPVVIAERRVDAEARREVGPRAERFAEQPLEPLRVVVAVGAERGAVRIDVVAEHDREVAPRAGATVAGHRGGDRLQAARGDPSAVRMPRGGRRLEFGRGPLVLEPLRALLGQELLVRQRRFVVLGLEVT